MAELETLILGVEAEGHEMVKEGEGSSKLSSLMMLDRERSSFSAMRTPPAGKGQGLPAWETDSLESWGWKGGRAKG